MRILNFEFRILNSGSASAFSGDRSPAGFRQAELKNQPSAMVHSFGGGQ